MTAQAITSKPFSPPWFTANFDQLLSPEAVQLKNYEDEILRRSMGAIYGRQTLTGNITEMTYGLPAIDALRDLADGWDGYGSPKPSENVIAKAGDVWDYSSGAAGPAPGLPRVTPGATGMVAFTWKKNGIELELWIHDTESFYGEWCISQPNAEPVGGETLKLDDLWPVLASFLEGF